MAIVNQTTEQMRQRAQETDDQKRAFEKSLKRSVLALLNKIADDFTVLYSATGDIVNAQVYNAELTSILRNSYRKVSDYFKDDYKRLLQEEIDNGNEDLQVYLDNRKDIQDDINAAVLLLILSRTQRQSEIITNTTNTVIQNSISKVTGDALLDGITLTNAEIARQSSKLIKERNDGRSKTISETEVQSVAESSKDIEATEFEEKIQVERREKQLDKTWITMGDSDVRPAHAKANGQKKRISEPYIVGGELLKFPGDTSLNASLGNIINCRCISVIS
jgi:uncharacterized protein with gpF-like domain